MSEAHERKIKRILSRDWPSLRTLWLDHVPHLPQPGFPPQLALSELTELGSLLSKLPKDQVAEVVESIPGLRSALLHDGLYLLHKSIHVLGSALIHASSGMCTWSLSSAYHAAFFGMKAVLSFLGVTIVEYENRHFLVDVWGQPQKPRKGVRGPITILANTARNEQRHMWAYFQRAVGETNNLNSVCSAALLTALSAFEYNDFARQRNNLHYRTNYWTFADLHKCAIQSSFGDGRVATIDSTDQGFSLILAYGLVRMGRSMLAELAQSSVALNGELSLVDAWLGEPFNGLYRQSTV